MRVSWLLVPILLLGLGASVVSAQDTIVRVPTPAPIADCPANHHCLEYEHVVLEIEDDPTCGPVLSVIVSETMTRTTTLAGITEHYGVRGLVLIQQGATYEVAGEFSGPATGPLATARFGSVGCVDWNAADA